ncbi:carbohydrate ABC transporter permease [Microbacterium invictum]|uniref:Raffinose/stachyose/melibiose transport system permease protein n=1 Tax=Microbacterium invictum TaxID=515415 RepID=A0AA40SQ49_9MICO|nr:MULTISPECIES: carbohydrate ABC transporter permease [Microbacterium]MBB4140276.1 raffinose/stachyose/melibiose transport system permease protein [Microbacterium invictum]
MNRYTWKTGVREGAMILLAACTLFPIYILVNIAIRPVTDISSPLIPTTTPTLDNFVAAWNGSGLGDALINSFLITAVTVLLLILLSSLAAYGIVRMTEGWSNVAFYFFMIGLFLPVQLGMIPLYRFFAANELLGSIFPIILIYLGLRMPFTVFLYVQFMRQIPKEYEESASMDGATPLQAFFRVVFPLSSAVTGTAVILNSLFTWNDFMLPLLYLGGTTNRTVPVAIYSFVGDAFTNWPVLFACLLIGMLPVLIVFLIVQKSLIRGFASGIKG